MQTVITHTQIIMGWTDLFTLLLSTEMLLAAASNTELHHWSENSPPGARPTWRRYYNEWSRPQAQHLQRGWYPGIPLPNSQLKHGGKLINRSLQPSPFGTWRPQYATYSTMTSLPNSIYLFIPTHSTMISLYPNFDWFCDPLLFPPKALTCGKKKKKTSCSTFPTWIAFLIMHTSHCGDKDRLSGHSCDRVGQNFDQHWTVLCSIWPLSFDQTHHSINMESPVEKGGVF